MQRTYIISWEINPDKQKDGDMYFDDHHVGDRDCSDRQFPKYPLNQAYMNGWLSSLGMETGYANELPVSNDDQYMDGYEIAQGERICHHPEDPDIRTLENDQKSSGALISNIPDDF